MTLTFPHLHLTLTLTHPHHTLTPSLTQGKRCYFQRAFTRLHIFSQHCIYFSQACLLSCFRDACILDLYLQCYQDPVLPLPLPYNADFSILTLWSPSLPFLPNILPTLLLFPPPLIPPPLTSHTLSKTSIHYPLTVSHAKKISPYPNTFPLT